MSIDYRTSPLYAAVQTARALLGELEARHEKLLTVGEGELLAIGREYAAALQEYSRAAMAWLSWIDREERRRRIATQGNT